MAREYKLVDQFNEHVLAAPAIVRVYDEPGMSWRDAKKALRKWYLDKAHQVREMREKDVFTKKDSENLEVVEQLVSLAS